MKLTDALSYHRYRPALTGRGVRVAIFEMYTDLGSPVYMSDNPDYHHDNMIYNLLHHMVPDADIAMLPNTNAGFKWAAENDVHIGVMSMNDSVTYGRYVVDAATSTLLITSAGNKGADGETRAARSSHWVAVGAAEMKGDLPVMESYSSYGGGHVMTVGLTDFYLDGIRTWGTSGAAPMVVGLMVQYYQHHLETLGYLPSPRTAWEFIKNNSHDFDHDGRDLRSGYGILRLPVAFELSDITLSPSRQTVLHREFVDGELVEVAEEPVYVEPYIEDGRMRVAIRDLEKLGLTAHWDGKTKTVHITG